MRNCSVQVPPPRPLDPSRAYFHYTLRMSTHRRTFLKIPTTHKWSHTIQTSHSLRHCLRKEAQNFLHNLATIPRSTNASTITPTLQSEQAQYGYNSASIVPTTNSSISSCRQIVRITIVTSSRGVGTRSMRPIVSQSLTS